MVWKVGCVAHLAYLTRVRQILECTIKRQSKLWGVSTYGRTGELATPPRGAESDDIAPCQLVHHEPCKGGLGTHTKSGESNLSTMLPCNRFTASRKKAVRRHTPHPPFSPAKTSGTRASPRSD